VSAHMDYEAEYSRVMSALNDIDTQLSQCSNLSDLFSVDRCSVEELSTRLQVFMTVELCYCFAHILLKRSHFMSVLIFVPVFVIEMFNN